MAQPPHVPAPAQPYAAAPQQPASPVIPEPAQLEDEPPAEGGGSSNRPSPVLLGLLVVVLLGYAVWNFVLKSDDEEPIAAPAPVTATTPATTTPAGSAPTGGSWADAVPKTLADGTASTDANTLDVREVAPARFSHQVELAQAELTSGEELKAVRVQPDGTIVALAVGGDSARWIATKADLDPKPVPSADALAAMQTLEASDIQAKVPVKLIRATERAKGVAPGELLLQHVATGPFGDAAAWTMTWAGLPTTLFSSADGHSIKA